MNPIIVGKELKENFKNLLMMQFPLNPAQSVFSELWKDFFSDFDSLVKGPYLQMPLPFKKSNEMSELTRFAPAMEKLEYMPYSHQTQAFNRISSPNFKPTLVATGTGSGKTECFTYPILSYCSQFKNKLGVRAIIIYPMNALATDQARRLAETIDKYPGLKGINVGLYIGDDSHVGRDKEMGKDHVITDREAILQSPPHILLTNYKMLDYMLIRAEEMPLWEKNDKSTLKYLVVDELHTFDGAQAADLACLIRRLKLRLKMDDCSLCCIGTSATLGTGETAQKEIREYAHKIFSREFDNDSIIPESRIEFSEMKSLTKNPIFDDEYVEAIFSILNKQIQTLDEVAFKMVQLSKKGELGDCEITLDEAKAKLYEVCQKLSDLRAKEGRDYPEVKLQYWIRELARMVVSLPRESFHRPHLEFSDDLTDPNALFDDTGLDNRYEDTQQAGRDRVNYFPVGNCNKCGSVGWTALITRGHDGVEGPRKTIYEHIMDERRRDDIVYLYPLKEEEFTPFQNGLIKNLCPKCLKFTSKERCENCHSDTIRVLIQKANQIDTTGSKFGHVCPYCGADHGHLLLIGMRSPVLLSTCISSITTSKSNTDKKIIAFSDNVQDTSYQAGFFGGRTWAATFRGLVAHYFNEKLQCKPTQYEDFANGFWEYLSSRYDGNRREIFGELIPQDLKWLHAWNRLTKGDSENPSDHDMSILEVRIKWELTLELGCKSQIGRTLTRVGVCEMKEYLPSLDDECWSKIAESICNKTEALRQFNNNPSALRECVSDIAELMIRNGAFRDTNGIVTAGILRRNGLALRSYEVQGTSGVLKSMDRKSSHVIVPGVKLGNRKLNEVITMSLENGASHFKEINKKYHLDEASLVEIFSELSNWDIVEKFENPGFNCYWILKNKWLKIYPCNHYNQSNPFRRQYIEGDIHRLNPQEHTGILKRDEREALEEKFKSKEKHTWYPNLISATPTLEMGVDIGDLSSVLLCSVPPSQSQFIQRIGRSGRANGSALNVTVANAKPHDLYFFREPKEMILGTVSSPGVFIDAVAILARQYVGYAISEWMLADVSHRLPKDVGKMFSDIKSDPTAAFPRNFFAWHIENKSKLYNLFYKRLSGIDYDTAEQLKKFVFSDNEEEDGLIGRFSKEMSSTLLTIKNYNDKREDLKQLKKNIEKDSSLTEEKKTEMLDDLTLEIKSYQSLIVDLKNQKLIAWLSDNASLLPNYAFPEPGVFLQSILWRKESKSKPSKFEPYEISRPASAGLTELVPGSVFYAHGHHVLIDQVDLQKYNKDEIEKCEWRFCPNCDHIEKNRPDISSECPNCNGSWADGSQIIKMLPVRQFITVKQSSESLNDDSSDQRKPEFYDTKKFFERKSLGSICKGYICESDDVPFGFEYVSHLVMREVNFGKRGRRNEGIELPTVNADIVTGLGFSLCPECGKTQPVQENVTHTKNCSKNISQLNNFDDVTTLNVNFYREYETEALRIFVPVFGLDDDVLISSLMAAIQLGLKEYYHGQVDHLAMELQSLPDKANSVRNRYIILYDCVPGGTGYLKQFVSEKDKQTLLFEILERALNKLTECECGKAVDKDGCYRCLYRFRNIGGRQNISRRAAIKLLSRLIPLKSTVKPAEGESIYSANAYTKALDSELERKFDVRLREFVDQFGDRGSRKDCFTKGFVPGMRFTIPGDVRLGGTDTPKTWEVVPQQEFGPDDGVLMMCKPDFVFYPYDENTREKAKPVAVFADGWLYHKDISDVDIQKRVSLMKAGFRVWSLTWNDIVSSKDKDTELPEPNWRKKVSEHANRQSIGEKFFKEDTRKASIWDTEFNSKNKEIERLFAYLQTGDDKIFQNHAQYEALLLGSLPSNLENLPITLPSGWSTVFNGDKVSDVSFDGFSARIVIKKDNSAYMNAFANAVAVLDDSTMLQQDVWQKFFGFVTYFQFLGEESLFFTIKSMSNSFWQQIASVTEQDGFSQEWEQTFADVEGDIQMTAVLKALKSFDVPAPICYEDYESSSGEMICNMWLKWESLNVCVISSEDKSPEGWKVIKVTEEMGVNEIVNAVKGVICNG